MIPSTCHCSENEPKRKKDDESPVVDVSDDIIKMQLGKLSKTLPQPCITLVGQQKFEMKNE